MSDDPTEAEKISPAKQDRAETIRVLRAGHEFFGRKEKPISSDPDSWRLSAGALQEASK